MRSATVARDKLIHDADTRADNFVLRLLTHLREILKVDRESTLLEKGKAGRNFDRGWQKCQSARETRSTMEESCSTLGIISDSPSARRKNLPTTQPRMPRSRLSRRESQYFAWLYLPAFPSRFHRRGRSSPLARCNRR